MEFFVNYKMHGSIEQLEGDYSFGFPYDKLSDIVANKEKAIEKIKEYLEKYWYVGHKNMGWYDIHKAKEKLYYGYWSFETSLDKGTQRKTTENELPSLTQCTA